MVILCIYLIIGILAVAYSEYELWRVKSDPVFGMLMATPTPVQRIANAFLVLIGWPLLVVRMLLGR